MRIVPSLFVWCLLLSVARAGTIGKVTITADEAPVLKGKETIATAKKGDVMDVTEIRGNWYGVLPHRGWIHSKYVKFEKARPKSPATASSQKLLPSQAAPPSAQTSVKPDQSSGRSTGGRHGQLVRIPIIIQPVSLAGMNFRPAFMSPEKLGEKLKEASDGAPDAAVRSIGRAAKLLGEMGGFKFEPVCFVGPKKRPLDYADTLPDDAKTFLFLRVSPLNREMLGRPTVAARYDAALIRRDDHNILHADSSLAMKVLHDSRSAELDSSDFARRAATAFAEDFGWKVLVPMQQRYFKEDIEADVTRIRAASNAKRPVPKKEPASGSATLAIWFKGPGTCKLHFQREEGGPFRRVTLRPGIRVDDFGPLKAKKAMIWAEVSSEADRTARLLYRAELSPEDGKRYVLELSGALP